MIILSERNLLTLLHKLRVPGSSRTIIVPTDTARATIVAVTDEEKYKDRKPGAVTPDTEWFIRWAKEQLQSFDCAKAASCARNDTIPCNGLELG